MAIVTPHLRIVLTNRSHRVSRAADRVGGLHDCVGTIDPLRFRPAVRLGYLNPPGGFSLRPTLLP
jgi:hypothetical protein